jgi:hypothetical protein
MYEDWGIPNCPANAGLSINIWPNALAARLWSVDPGLPVNWTSTLTRETGPKSGYLFVNLMG